MGDKKLYKLGIDEEFQRIDRNKEVEGTYPRAPKGQEALKRFY